MSDKRPFRLLKDSGVLRQTIKFCIARSRVVLAALVMFLFCLLYSRTAAPSVLSGDSAEFQLAAVLLGVPHPTTYPLYILLGKLSTMLIPFGDLARRVTLVSVGCGALSIGLFLLLARYAGITIFAALAGTLALGLAPGIWNAATLAEVYALLLLLLLSLGLLIAHWRSLPDSLNPTSSAILAAGIAGLGTTHHALFVLIGLPIFFIGMLWPLIRRKRMRSLLILGVCFVAGLSPLLYPPIQYARFGPFDGKDYGLPKLYFWGSPQSWGAMLDLLSGGTVRRDIVRVPSPETIVSVLRMLVDRSLFEFGLHGILLGLLGASCMFLRQHPFRFATLWCMLATFTYLLLLGPAVTDAPIFTLPMLLPWALWIAYGVDIIFKEQRTGVRGQGSGVRGQGTEPNNREPRTENKGLPDPSPPHILALSASLRLCGKKTRPGIFAPKDQKLNLRYIRRTFGALLLLGILAWGYTRLPYSNKRHLWLFREFGQATLDRLPQDAVVLTHWEQGTTLQYMILVEHRRPDVWIDIVEPGDEPWLARARRRYSDRPVFLVGGRDEVATLPVAPIYEHAYATLFNLQINK